MERVIPRCSARKRGSHDDGCGGGLWGGPQRRQRPREQKRCRGRDEASVDHAEEAKDVTVVAGRARRDDDEGPGNAGGDAGHLVADTYCRFERPTRLVGEQQPRAIRGEQPTRSRVGVERSEPEEGQAFGSREIVSPAGDSGVVDGERPRLAFIGA